MIRLWLTLFAAVAFSSMSIAGGLDGNAKSEMVGKSALPREGAKYWMGGCETTQLLPLSLDVMAEDGEWLFVSGGKVKKADVVALEEAVPYYQSLLKTNPKNAWAIAMLGWYYVVEDDYAKARPLLERALQIDTKNVDAWLAMGLIYGNEDEYESAIKQFDEAIRVRPDCALAFCWRGFYKLELGDEQSAIADYNAAIKICPMFSDAYMGRGALYHNSEKWKEALSDFDKTLSLDPYNNVTLVRRARIRATCPVATFRDGKLAIQDAQKACEISKYEEWEDLEVLAAAYAETGRFDEAVKIQTKAIELTQTGRRFLMRLQLERYKQKKTYRFPPTEEYP